MDYFDCVETKNIYVQPLERIKPILVSASLNANGDNYYDYQKTITTKYACAINAETGIVRLIAEDAGFISPFSGERVFGIDDYPTELTFDGTWAYNSDIGEFSQVADIVAANALKRNTTVRNGLLRAALAEIEILQCSAAVGNQRDSDADNLLALQRYVDELRNVDLTANPVTFPVMPESIK